MTSKKATSTAGKATIYVDVDDEITNIIDKVKTSDHKIIALVLPKRASMLQSVVNMKLLKKAAVGAKKNLVLITSETGLLPLAGAAGLHVARSLSSKPEIPPPPGNMSEDTEEMVQPDDEPVTLDKRAPVGALAAAAGHDDDTETIELDNMEVEPVPKSASLKPKKHKALKVPNFERFRLGFVLAGLALVLLIVGWLFAAIVLPKATVTIETDTTPVVSSFDFTASVTQTELDIDGRKIPATMKEAKKTESQKVAATGERDEGTKASGEVTLTASCVTTSTTVPAGTTVSTGGLNYITQASANINVPSGGGPGTWVCSRTVDVLAAENGEKFNQDSGKSFTVSGYAGVSGKNNDDITGGTSKLVSFVSQKDIDEATAKLSERLGSGAQDELKALLETEGLYSLSETFKAGEPAVKSTPAVNEEAKEATLSYEVTFTMLGIDRADLVQIIAKDIEGEIDPQRQVITDDGIDAAIMRVNNNTVPSEVFLNFRTTVTAGPQLDETAIKEAIRGKKRGEGEKYIADLPGVNDAVIEYSPFWVYSTPKATKKITIVVEKAE